MYSIASTINKNSLKYHSYMVFDFNAPIQLVAHRMEMGMWGDIHMRFLTPIKQNMK